VCSYEGNVKEEQVVKLHAKVEALSKKVAALLQLLPDLAQRFDVSFQHVVQHVTRRQRRAAPDVNADAFAGFFCRNQAALSSCSPSFRRTLNHHKNAKNGPSVLPAKVASPA
jgi:hypothetical protein